MKSVFCLNSEVNRVESRSIMIGGVACSSLGALSLSENYALSYISLLLKLKVIACIGAS